MKRFVLLLSLLTLLFHSILSAQSRVMLISVQGSINPASAEYVHDALADAQERKDVAFILELNTPGGLLQSTRSIVTDLLSSSIPVIVFVHPRGGRAASAGAFITMAAHVAAMAPGTNIGAAHPVTMEEGKNNDDSSNIMITKATNDAIAFAKTIAEKRHRDIGWADSSVRKSASITETEALSINVIDLIANDLVDLLAKLDGRVVETTSGCDTLHTANAIIDRRSMSFREELLDILSNPNIAYILMMLGIYGILFELYNPGSIFPGVMGGICLILAFYSMNTLPVNYAGIALILFGIILFLLEIKIVSHGLLSIGGVIALFLGSVMLYQTPSGIDFIEVSMSLILTVTICSAGFFLFVVGKGVAIMRRKAVTGQEGLCGERGVVVESLSPKGRVHVHGEYWSAISDEGEIPAGTSIAIHKIHNLELVVGRSVKNNPDETTS